MTVDHLEPLRKMDKRDAARSTVYRLLSDLFAYEMSAEKISGLAQMSDAYLGGETASLAPLLGALAGLGQDPVAAERHLAGVFAFLFLGVGGKHSAPPYESVYRAGSDDAGQHPAAQISRVLRRLDLHITEVFPEPSDHIAIELAAAAAFIESGAPAEEQAGFLADHLQSWLPDFAKACEAGDSGGFYAIAAQAADRFVTLDIARIQGRAPKVTIEEEDNA
jgi:TorA-specific chaperone